MAQSVTSATDTLGCTYLACLPQILTRDSGLASALSMPKDVGMQLKPVLVTTPNMSVQGDNTTPTVLVMTV